jgi:membrane-associated phospholipid phosphatase
VYNSIGIHLAVMNNRRLRKNKTVQMVSFILMVSIILATMFIKQHSVFDVCCAFLLAYIMYRIVYKPGTVTVSKPGAVPRRHFSR